ncbi:MAG: hypothetical protein LQ350_008150 [Teloschistes chrysophthalmus]|nr:MAG: hypothetical protein LQ350_008150 [Niorma chrysophthalma]
MWPESGGDPNTNSELSTILAQAKKAGIPKDLIERAVAKGKGLSTSGEPLQSMTMEAILPPSVAVIVECQTDNKRRTRENIRYIVKQLGGTVGPTTHLFQRRGHVLLDSDILLEEVDVMAKIVETEAVDYDFTEGETSLSIYTEPDQTTSVAQTLSDSLDLTIRSSNMKWIPREELLVKVDNTEDEDRLPISDMISQIEADSDVQAVYHNAVLDTQPSTTMI